MELIDSAEREAHLKMLDGGIGGLIRHGKRALPLPRAEVENASARVAWRTKGHALLGEHEYVAAGMRERKLVRVFRSLVGLESELGPKSRRGLGFHNAAGDEA